MEQEEDHMEQEENQVFWGAEAYKEDLVTNASGEWRCILNGGPSHFVPQLLFSVNFSLFALHLTFFSFFNLQYLLFPFPFFKIFCGWAFT